MDPAAPLPPGGLPWTLAVSAIIAVCLALVGLWKWPVAKIDAVRADADARVQTAHEANESLRLEMQKRLDDAERRADAVDLSFREHLEHDARVFRGEADRRNPPRYKTGNAALDAKRFHAESISQRLPSEVVAKVREIIDRGETSS